MGERERENLFSYTRIIKDDLIEIEHSYTGIKFSARTGWPDITKVIEAGATLEYKYN